VTSPRRPVQPWVQTPWRPAIVVAIGCNRIGTTEHAENTAGIRAPPRKTLNTRKLTRVQKIDAERTADGSEG